MMESHWPLHSRRRGAIGLGLRPAAVATTRLGAQT